MQLQLVHKVMKNKMIIGHKISKSTMIDENLHTGIITFSLNDISEKFTLGGYAEYENSGKQFSVLSVQNYKLDLNTITNSNSLSYLAYGFGDGTEFNLDADRAIPIVANIKYDNNDTPEGLFSTIYRKNNSIWKKWSCNSKIQSCR